MGVEKDPSPLSPSDVQWRNGRSNLDVASSSPVQSLVFWNVPNVMRQEYYCDAIRCKPQPGSTTRKLDTAMEDTVWPGPLYARLQYKYDTAVYSQENPTKPVDPKKPVSPKAQTQASDFFDIINWIVEGGGRAQGIPKSDPRYSW
jgi:hypothetical protein